MAYKNNVVIRLQRWMDSVPGQTFLNYAYSWGAAIVILGTLFKLTHLKGANLMLFVGMGTEVVVFFLSAFDRPFNKEEIGKELPREFVPELEAHEDDGHWSEEEQLAEQLPAEEIGGSEEIAESGASAGAQMSSVNMPNAAAEATNNSWNASGDTSESDRENTQVRNDVSATASAASVGAIAAARQEGDVEQLAQIIRMANDELLHRAQAVLSPEMEEATRLYIDKLDTLNDTLSKVDEQNRRLTQDSEEMENLNRTLTGINKVYELHLKSISLQVGTIDDINEQTQKLAVQIQRLNEVYARMIDAMTVNVGRQGGDTSTL